ncbi:FAD-binding oxidoreductase [Chondrinema litorale]|uniref:FAD-binding oxidoreductase n=1 Tax=Chondrinema litorale TaxID=2994555 RepID=UPI0025427FE7|nr:FAD-binding oxidoreductase [Chondrinema litorale]UZR96366.1 FAD-binding oxidoreductase [Chondrinema litorale]
MPNAPKWVFDVAERLMPKLPLMEVTKTESLSAEVKRVQFKGDFNTLNIQVGSYMDFRVSDTEVRRYTISYIDHKKSIIEFIVHIHGKGAGSQFMNNFQIGNIANVNQARAHKYYEESVEKYVIFGDETSLGLACSFLPVLKQNGHQFQYYFELEDANKNVPQLLQLENFTVFPKNGSFENDNWLNYLPIFQTPDWQEYKFILTGNVKSAKAFRKLIKKKCNAKIILHGYWLEGKKGL